MRFNSKSAAMVAAAAALIVGVAPVAVAAPADAGAASTSVTIDPATKKDMGHVKAGQILTISQNIGLGNKADGEVKLEGAATFVEATFAADSPGKDKSSFGDGNKKLDWSWEASDRQFSRLTVTFQIKVAENAKSGDTVSLTSKASRYLPNGSGKYVEDSGFVKPKCARQIGPLTYTIVGTNKKDPDPAPSGSSSVETPKPKPSEVPENSPAPSAPATSSAAPSEAPSKAPSKAPETAPSESAEAAPAPDRAEGDLAKTGASVGPAVGIGAAVVALAGGAMLFFAKHSRRNN